MSEAQKKAYILADNRLALDATWDEELLRLEIESLKDLEFDISLTGFEDFEIGDLTTGDAETAEDNFDVAAEMEKPCVAKLGDVWTLDKHKIICGDSTLPETYQKLLGDRKVNLICTDPPYFVKFENSAGTIANDDLNDAEGYEFLKKVFDNFKVAMAVDASIYVFYASVKGRIFHDAFEDAGFKVGAGLVWKKDHLVLTRANDLVLDGFLGSASTLIACEKLGRVCYGIEIEPKFIDVAVERYAAVAGSRENIFVLREGKNIPLTEI